MASSTVEEKGGGPVTDETYDYPEEVFVDGDVSGAGVDDPGSSQEEAEEPKKESGKGAENLKMTLIISGAVVAVIGAIFAIAKKIKEA
ncbi:hypothetical protein BUALT_Bualt02G0025700 [Buddleja alternifolia]|uniref:Uncharacterized protein n=1 Tax=Buddleja alternifolia TaxID=168488 RepID=A0AAV6Y3M0_9LAMI|nr:hypothetical protein BUALT_Bualt02G0025700 [Buddleja alternifolia]